MPLVPRPGIENAPPYVPGGHRTDSGLEPAILSANENPLGPSPAAREAYLAAAASLHRYPDGASADVRAAIGARFGLDPARIVCGAGSDELITLLTRLFVGPGDEVIYSRHGFLMYPINAIQAGATPVAVPEVDLLADVDGLLARVTDRTRIIFLANPNNPTGGLLDAATVSRLAGGVPDHVLLVLDAAYAEYVERDGYTPGADVVDRHDNVVMLRTFSKAFGMAALRLGWCYAPRRVVDLLERLRNPFNVGLATQAAGVAALDDWGHIERAREHNRAWLSRLQAAMAEMGLKAPPSAGNFFLAGFEDEATAARANAFLLERGVIVRPMGMAGLPEYLRITVGLEWENNRLLDALRAFRQQ